MKLTGFILRNFIYHRRSHLAICVGVALSTAIIIGALIVGDSVKLSLKQFTLARLGQTNFALQSGQFFSSSLAMRLSEDINVKVAPLLQVSGIAVNRNTQARVNNIQVLGVDQRFWQLSSAGKAPATLAPDEAIISHNLAHRLGLKPGAEFLLRTQKRSLLSADAPLAEENSSLLALQLKVKAIAAENEFGRFDLRANQVPPCNVYLPYTWLSQELDLQNLANIMLVGPGVKLESLQDKLRDCRQLADTGLYLKPAGPDKVLELRSRSIFLTADIAKAALRVGHGAQGIFTYFVNQLRTDTAAVPYSFVSAPGLPIVPSDMEDEEIIVNEWLAKELGLKQGDRLEIAYYVVGPMRKITEKQSSFRVHSIVPIQNTAADHSLVPDFPGLSHTENCRDWHSSIPIDLTLIRNRDEDYWDKYKGTPKAFITLKAAQRMWQNRFGILTAVRYPGNKDPEALKKSILKELQPVSSSLNFYPVREQGIQASMQAVDFGATFHWPQFFSGSGCLVINEFAI